MVVRSDWLMLRARQTLFKSLSESVSYINHICGGTMKTYIRADTNGVHLDSIRHRDTHQTSACMRSCITSSGKSTAASQSDKITAAIITAIKTCGLHADNEVLVLQQRQWNSKFYSLGGLCVQCEATCLENQKKDDLKLYLVYVITTYINT